jgi:RHS repeat-associated protein
MNNTTNQWQSGAVTNPTAYAIDYTYDAMGNILSQKRNGGGASATALDELTYNYHTTTDGLVSNRLYQVNDVVSAGNYTDDIDDQGTFNNTHSTIETANNYGYDELGNLVRDVQEEIASIEWTVYGKMKKITRNSGSSKADLEFGYDASGNHLWKKVTPKGSGAVISTYYYLRDAQGNEMCRYVKYTNTTSQLMYVAQEHSIYGSSRVGVDGRKDTLYKAGNYSPSWGGVGTSRRDLGSKSFELANHLGNVLVTVSDKPIYKVSSATIFFQPEVTSISDYYPFGAPIHGRGYSSETYRFGFNTQEKDDEIKGEGNSYTTEFRKLDPRLGRWLSIDPKASSMPWQSPYCSMDNNPIWFNDVLGDSTKYKIIETGKEHVLDGSDAIFEISQTDFNDLKYVYDNYKYELYDKHLGRLGLGTKGYDLALEARKQLGSTDWAYDVSNPPFAANQNKCNQFVWDMCKAVDPNSLSNYTAGSPPRAGDTWGSPIKKINGTEIINATTDNIKLGDIVGGKTNYRDASGHVEIVTGIDPISGKITSTGAGSKKIRKSIFVQNVLEEKIWSDHIYSPFAVRRLK